MWFLQAPILLFSNRILHYFVHLHLLHYHHCTVLEQIQSGKCVNFDLLLPATSPLPVEDYTIKVNSAGSEPSVSLVPRAQSRPRIIDFYSWLTMTAWNYYLQAMSFYHPTRVPELIMYQSIIVRFACQYTFASWYTYDKLFRYQMANHPMIYLITI